MCSHSLECFSFGKQLSPSMSEVVKMLTIRSSRHCLTNLPTTCVCLAVVRIGLLETNWNTRAMKFVYLEEGG